MSVHKFVKFVETEGDYIMPEGNEATDEKQMKA